MTAFGVQCMVLSCCLKDVLSLSLYTYQVSSLSNLMKVSGAEL